MTKPSIVSTLYSARHRSGCWLSSATIPLAALALSLTSSPAATLLENVWPLRYDYLSDPTNGGGYVLTNTTDSKVGTNCFEIVGNIDDGGMFPTIFNTANSGTYTEFNLLAPESSATDRNLDNYANPGVTFWYKLNQVPPTSTGNPYTLWNLTWNTYFIDTGDPSGPNILKTNASANSQLTAVPTNTWLQGKFPLIKVPAALRNASDFGKDSPAVMTVLSIMFWDGLPIDMLFDDIQLVDLSLGSASEDALLLDDDWDVTFDGENFSGSGSPNGYVGPETTNTYHGTSALMLDYAASPWGGPNNIISEVNVYSQNETAPPIARSITNFAWPAARFWVQLQNTPPNWSTLNHALGFEWKILDANHDGNGDGATVEFAGGLWRLPDTNDMVWHERIVPMIFEFTNYAAFQAIDGAYPAVDPFEVGVLGWVGTTGNGVDMMPDGVTPMNAILTGTDPSDPTTSLLFFIDDIHMIDFPPQVKLTMTPNSPSLGLATFTWADLNFPMMSQGTPLTTNVFQLSGWPYTTNEFQSAPSVLGPWTTIANATSGYSEPIAKSGDKFYRVLTTRLPVVPNNSNAGGAGANPATPLPPPYVYLTPY